MESRLIESDDSPSQSDGPIRVLICDDDPLVREYLVRALERVQGVQVVGAVASLRDALNTAAEAGPDVLLLDYYLGESTAIDVLGALPTAETPRVLILTGSIDAESAAGAFRAGAKGILSKTEAPRLLADAVNRVYSGHTWLSPEWAEVIAVYAARPIGPVVASIGEYSDLTRRERDIVRLVADGRSNREVAAALSVSEVTVKSHLTRLFNKLGVANRTQLALRVRNSRHAP